MLPAGPFPCSASAALRLLDDGSGIASLTAPYIYTTGKRQSGKILLTAHYLMKALAKDPDDRYSSIEEFRKAYKK